MRESAETQQDSDTPRRPVHFRVGKLAVGYSPTETQIVKRQFTTPGRDAEEGGSKYESEQRESVIM